MQFDDFVIGEYYRDNGGDILKLLERVGKYDLMGRKTYVLKFSCGDVLFAYDSETPEFDIKPIGDILTGQVWVPRDGGELIEVETFGGDVVWYIGQGSGFAESAYIEDFLRYYERLEWVDGAVIASGASCNKCGEYFEYAERVDNFRCWGCRNGW